MPIENRKRPFRARVNQNELEMLRELRAFEKSCKEQGLNSEQVKHGWFKSKETSLFVKNPNFKSEDSQKADEFRTQIIEELKDHAPNYPTIKRSKSNDGHLLVVDPADIHVGKLCSSFETGEEYNQQIAVKRVKEGVQGIIDKAQGWKIEKILFIGGNDVLHTDTPNKTTAGTPQDTDGMWYENFLTAKRLYIDILETLIAVADVHFVFNPSNHDYQSGFFLANVIETHFRNAENITFNCSISHRKYSTFGTNLIGTTHGDGAKFADLPLLMAQESAEWSETKHRYIYTHHIHHKQSKDFGSVCVESLRSPSSTDSWHHRKGFQHSPKAVEGFIHHKEFGQIARLTHIF
jgi:hypothetical protein